MIDSIIVFLLSLVGPLLLIPVEKIFPYPHWVEEIVKLVIVYILLKSPRGKIGKIVYLIGCGLVFSLSESIFYLNNLIGLKKLSLFFLRFFLTGLLHTTTMVITWLVGKKRSFWPWSLAAGYLLAVAVHWLYNYFILVSVV